MSSNIRWLNPGMSNRNFTCGDGTPSRSILSIVQLPLRSCPVCCPLVPARRAGGSTSSAIYAPLPCLRITGYSCHGVSSCKLLSTSTGSALQQAATPPFMGRRFVMAPAVVFIVTPPLSSTVATTGHRCQRARQALCYKPSPPPDHTSLLVSHSAGLCSCVAFLVFYKFLLIRAHIT